MMRRFAMLALGALVFGPSVAFADALPAKPDAAETAFVTKIASDLGTRFPTPEAAEKAGYLRFGDEDDTGAISYANREWSSRDPAHPSQLWYDAKGRLLGADYSVLGTSAPKDFFGVQASRWQPLHAHVHYGLVGPGGTTTYGATGPSKFATIGANAAKPTPADLVKLGIAKSESDVRFVFAFPLIEDLTVWVLPNPDGAFADKNPNVKPVHPAAMPM
jgi:hypothetical protein